MSTASWYCHTCKRWFQRRLDKLDGCADRFRCATCGKVSFEMMCTWERNRTSGLRYTNDRRRVT